MRLLKKKYNHITLKKQLLIVIDLLDQYQIPYHLEGGTLLGIVRGGDLIPWDHDTDISIMAENYTLLEQILHKIENKNLRVKVKELNPEYSFNPSGKQRLIKIKDKNFFGLMSGDNTLDIFIKYPINNKVYWQAQDNTMCVNNKFYQGYEEIEWENRKIKVPLHYKEYLTLKYGDWHIINKQWDCDMEFTIIEKRRDNNQ